MVFAQAHVVGQTGAESQFIHEPEPMRPLPLIRTQLRLQLGARVGFTGNARLLHLVQHFFERAARHHARPIRLRRLGLRLARLARIKARQQSQTFQQWQAIRPGVGLNIFPVVEDLLQLLLVHFNPFALEPNQPAGGMQKGVQFRLRQRFALKRQIHLEIQQPFLAEQISLGRADSHTGLRPRWTGRLPPIRNADDQAALLEEGMFCKNAKA